jgi:hypothetical protein
MILILVLGVLLPAVLWFVGNAYLAHMEGKDA